jgi:hypothetical protein
MLCSICSGRRHPVCKRSGSVDERSVASGPPERQIDSVRFPLLPRFACILTLLVQQYIYTFHIKHNIPFISSGRVVSSPSITVSATIRLSCFQSCASPRCPSLSASVLSSCCRLSSLSRPRSSRLYLLDRTRACVVRLLSDLMFFRFVNTFALFATDYYRLHAYH